MSWQEYVDSSMVGAGHIDKGAIYSVKGDSKWASSPGFDIKPTEMQEVIQGLKGNTDQLWGRGLYIEGEKYVVTKAEGRSLYARKGLRGVVIVKTEQAILVGHYKEGHIAGNAATTVENLADYLVKVGY